MNNLVNQMSFNINEIIKILPHRYPFILIDKIDIVESGKSLIALKNMTINEPFFQGHFPGQPVMPGVLSLEIMAQAGSFLMLSQIEDPLSMNMFFSTVEKAKFRKPIIPGDQLKVHMDLVKRKLNLCKFHGKCFVDETLVAEATFAANLVARARE
ncbi:MAG: 3-hydroxyacyl-ACP dehydratase FabZ [Fidelibacterota bacterium]|jgi:3-hydroxyacyl-[acyl-carrier-protein] dehydratase|tara:strand:- start:242 stop:706 length:465 start_codon:yes stop_codon:yes gene_type:complete